MRFFACLVLAIRSPPYGAGHMRGQTNFTMCPFKMQQIVQKLSFAGEQKLPAIGFRQSLSSFSQNFYSLERKWRKLPIFKAKQQRSFIF
jgi:hypothetical protein